MRSTNKTSSPQPKKAADRDAESILLALLNLGKKRQNVPIGAQLIESSKDKRPEDWTKEVQARITALSRMSINISETLRALPPIPANGFLYEAARRDQIVKPLNDAFSSCTLALHFRLDWNKGIGQGFLMEEVLSAGIANPVEGLAMMGLSGLMKRGEIEDLRECGVPSCGAWFIANKRRRKEHTFCSLSCRQKNKRSTPEFKDQRRNNYNTKKFLRTPKRKKVKADAKADR